MTIPVSHPSRGTKGSDDELGSLLLEQAAGQIPGQMVGMNVPHCVLCWIDKEMVRQASYIYDGKSVCSRHLYWLTHPRDADTVEE